MNVALIDPSLFSLSHDAGLAAGLREEGHDVVIHGRRPGPDDEDATGVPLRYTFYHVASAPIVDRAPRALRLAVKGIDHAWSMRRLLRYLRERRPDVIHFQWLPLPVVDRRFLRPLRRVAPLVLTVHDTNPFNGAPTGRVQAIGMQAAFRDFDRLIVHTSQGRDRLVAHGEDPGRILVLPPGPLCTAPAELPDDKMVGTITFLLFGKLKPYKGADTLIEAFARLPAALRAQARLHVVGKSYMDTRPLRALAEQRGIAGQVTWDLRFIAEDEFASFFAPGVVAAFPYTEIEASGVLTLAVTYGRPILASRLGRFAEEMENGNQGLLVPPGDVAALSAAMARFVEDRAFAAACAANVRRLTLLSWRDVAAQTANLYSMLTA